MDEYLVRADVHRTYIDFVCNEYNKFDEERKHLSPALFSLGVPVRNCIPGFAMHKNPCNLDPWGHYSSALESTLLLERKFKLSLPERLSLLRAMAVAPNSAYMYVAMASSLLQVRHLNPIHHKNYQFGLLLANLMTDIHKALVTEKRTLPPRRFNCYAKYIVPDEQEWNKQCDRLLLLHFTTPDTKVKSEQRSAYKEVRCLLADIFPYVDVLGGNHLVAIAGTLGVLPLWVTSEIEIHKGRSITWLLTKFFPDKQERTKIKVDDVVANVKAALTTRCDTNFSRRTVENIVCKVFRRYTKNKSDAWFHDILLPQQNLYSVKQKAVQVMSVDGNSTEMLKHPLLHMVPFHGMYISLEELHQQIPNDWPGWEPSLSGLGRHLLDGLFDSARGNYPEPNFEINQPTVNNRWLSDKFCITERRMLT